MVWSFYYLNILLFILCFLRLRTMFELIPSPLSLNPTLLASRGNLYRFHPAVK